MTSPSTPTTSLSSKPCNGKYSADSMLMASFPVQINVNSMTLPANTSDICCHPKVSSCPIQSPDYPRLAQTLKSQGHSIIPWLHQLLPSFHLWILWNHCSTYKSYP